MMKESFYHFGETVYRFRFAIIIFWILLATLSFIFLLKTDNPFKETGFKDPTSESAKTDDYLNKELGNSANHFVVLYTSDEWLATDHAFQNEIRASLKKLKTFPFKHQIIYPDHQNQISADKHNAYASVLFKDTNVLDDKFVKLFKKNLRQPPDLTMQVAGETIFQEDTKKQTQIDLYKAEYIATPVAIITMLIIFGSVIAASLPIILGVFFGLIILSVLFWLGHVVSLSIFTLNIAMLLGLCISIDYALFMVSRFRQEIHRTKSVMEAIAVTQATAGKAIFFSGIAVLISLSALLFFPINIMFSVGIGGITSVALAIAMSLLLLPAILAVLGHHINGGRVPRFKRKFRFWQWLAKHVIRHRWLYFIGSLLLLFTLSFPILDVQFGVSDTRILPKSLESRAVYDTFQEKFGEGKLTPISVLVPTKNSAQINALSEEIKKDPRVLKVLNSPTAKNFTVIQVVSKYSSTSPDTLALVKTIGTLHAGKNLAIAVTGPSANMLDALHSVSHLFLYAVAWTMFFTYLILLITFRSLFLPLKAIVMNVLSLCASYGILTFVFQQGHFQTLLNFSPQCILDINLLVIIFCSLFGFSMDYEVFLLSRIKEEYEKTHDNIQSTIIGIDSSSRIITSAAIIVILICFSFMSADILIVKAFGLGIASAIFVDAFLIRTILVPATMAILGKWNWYLPKWLNKILPKISFNPENNK